MSIAQPDMVNESYNPSDREEQVLSHLKDGQDCGKPWGYTSASIAGEALGMPRQYTSSALSQLAAAGWVTRVKPEGTGVYRFVNDPRETDALAGDGDE